MRQWVRWLGFGGIIGAMVMLAVGEASAQRVFGFGRSEGEVEFGLDWSREDTRSAEASSKFQKTRYEERLGIRRVGSFILHPRLITSNFGGTFGLFQEEDRFDGQESSRTGTLLGYSFDSVILSEKPYTVTLFTNRNQSVLSREFGGRSEITFENRGGTFRLREDSFLQALGFPYFTSVLGARQELTEEETTVLGQTFRRDEVRTVVSYDGNKGFQTSDLNLRYEFTDLDDRENPRGNFQSHTAGLSYSLDFGPTLNRRWDSRLRYFSRTGRTRSTFLSADEELRLDHHEDLFTDYRYRFSLSEAEAGVTTTHTGAVLLQHQLYKSLTTRLQSDGSLQDLPSGERVRYGGEVDLGYRRALPWRGQLFGGAGTRYQVDDNRFTVSRIDVIDEPHTAPVPLGGGAGFTLANPFVITSTIVVVDTRGGARLATTLGVDYVIVQEGDSTKIVPLAGSPVILAGDPLAVSYAFEVDPSLKFSAISWHGTAGVDFRWIALSFAHQQTEQTRLSGRDGRFLDDRTSDTARLELRGEWERVRALATALYQIQESRRLEFTTWRFGQFLSFRPRFDLVLSLNAQESFTEFTVPRRRSESYSARGDLTWTPLPSLFVNGFAGLRVFQDSELPTETVREAGLRAGWSFGKLEVAPTFTWTDRERGTVETTNLRGDLRVIRRF